MVNLVTWKILIFEKFWDLSFKNPKDLKSSFTVDSVCGGPIILDLPVSNLGISAVVGSLSGLNDTTMSQY